MRKCERQNTKCIASGIVVRMRMFQSESETLFNWSTSNQTACISKKERSNSQAPIMKNPKATIKTMEIPQISSHLVIYLLPGEHSEETYHNFSNVFQVDKTWRITKQKHQKQKKFGLLLSSSYVILNTKYHENNRVHKFKKFTQKDSIFLKAKHISYIIIRYLHEHTQEHK